MSADAQVLHILYRDHHNWLQGWLRRRLGNGCDAADLAQDTFVRLLRAGNAASIREPRDYLATVARGLMVDFLRRRSLEQAYLDCGAAKNTKFGDAACILCDANELFRVTRHVLAPDPEAFVTKPVIPAQRWKELCTETR